MYALILSGTHLEPDKLVHGMNKGFLKLQGRTVVSYVVDAALAAKTIDQVYVVGPEDLLRQVLPTSQAQLHIIPQEGKIIRNAWKTFCAMFPDEKALPTDSLLESHYQVHTGHLKPSLKLEIAAFLAHAFGLEEHHTLSKEAVESVISQRTNRLIRIEHRPKYYLTKYILLELLDSQILHRNEGGFTLEGGALRAFLLEYYRRLVFPVCSLTCDIPLILPETIDHFVREWERSDRKSVV